jgi:hypothetical protein
MRKESFDKRISFQVLQWPQPRALRIFWLQPTKLKKYHEVQPFSHQHLAEDI